MKTHMMLNEVFSGHPRRIGHGLDQFEIRLPAARMCNAQGNADRLTKNNERPRLALNTHPVHVQRLTQARFGGINIPTDQTGMHELQSLDIAHRQPYYPLC